MFIGYVLITAYFGTWLFIQGFLHLKFEHAIARIEQVPLGNNFVYITENKSVADVSGRIIVPSGLEKIKINGSVIHGHYDDLQQDTLYFICISGEDCSNSTKYNKQEYMTALRKKDLSSLPFPFTFPFFEDHISLVTSEWLKRKITFQNAPPTPFFQEQNDNKVMKEGIEFVWEIMAGIFKYTAYGIYVFLFVAVFVFFLAICACKKSWALIKSMKPSESLVILGSGLFAGLLKSYVLFASFIVTLLVVLSEFN